MTSSGERVVRVAGRGTRDRSGSELAVDGSWRPFLTSVSASIGVSSIATAKETINAMATVNDIARMNSPGAPGRYARGRNDATMVRVAASTGTASSVGDRQAASNRLMP